MDQVLDTAATIALDVRPVLSYAMAHNGIPVVSRLTVDGIDRDAPGARIILEVSDRTGPIGTPQDIVIDRPGQAGSSTRSRRTNVSR
ncbi:MULTISPECIES: hypothetical protein [unclassified Pseudonocardia]|uniref:hypothetical protein n=1 Tax=unclassified Pseudonocardia TaxID=2619320 RepID=UPI0002E8E594|nr:hypothetical protein [Pseudonocardia sp. Ae707_Ps1]OLM09125.1 hypothetical protein Ae707Ps1_6072 [Pseudonocardia sp. Ae707_Ps1]